VKKQNPGHLRPLNSERTSWQAISACFGLTLKRNSGLIVQQWKKALEQNFSGLNKKFQLILDFGAMFRWPFEAGDAWGLRPKKQNRIPAFRLIEAGFDKWISNWPISISLFSTFGANDKSTKNFSAANIWAFASVLPANNC
jgi:hypothetical protein